jgi:hypothetical protein
MALATLSSDGTMVLVASVLALSPLRALVVSPRASGHARVRDSRLEKFYYFNILRILHIPNYWDSFLEFRIQEMNIGKSD